MKSTAVMIFVSLNSITQRIQRRPLTFHHKIQFFTSEGDTETCWKRLETQQLGAIQEPEQPQN